MCAIDVKVPTREEVLESPRRAWFIAGGWVNDSEPETVYVYWHRRRKHFTVYSLLQILEHEILHAVLLRAIGVEASMRLDRIHRCSCVRLMKHRLVFVNKFRAGKWEFPPYSEMPTEDLLE